jgi:methylation protein EvaC
LGLDDPKSFDHFRARVEKSRIDLVDLLMSLKSQGKRVAGYGATSKSTTILNYCGIGPDLVEYVSDTTPTKQGKFTPGTHIPVVPHSHFLQNRPDYTVLFAWNHADEILSKEAAYSQAGGKWILHVPFVQVLG